MRAARIVATGSVSALGRGAAAFEPGGTGGIAHDPALAEHGLRRPRSARAQCAATDPESDPAETLLGCALDDVLAELSAAVADWRQRRLVVVIGTSSGGMWSQTRAFDAQAAAAPSPALCRAAPYWGPLRLLRARLPGVPVIQVLAACASSAMSIGIGCRLLDADLADLVLVGGYDAVTPFVAAGFEALGVTSATLPRPFSLKRDGLVLGEGAALLVLTHAPGPGRYLLGFGATSDATHPTAPAADGAQLAQAAALAALDAGGLGGPVLISAHATATILSDRAEANAIASIVESGVIRELSGVHAFKASLGHSLGAGSALELLAGLRCLELGHIPSLPDPPHEELPRRSWSARAGAVPAGAVLKLASAFGGSNVALVARWLSGAASLEAVAARPTARSFDVSVSQLGAAHLTPDLERVAAHTEVTRLHVLRLDPLTALCATAVLDLMPAPSAGKSAVRKRVAVVLGSIAATLEHNAGYQARLRERGHAAADARRFPATSPNLAPGMLSILFGLTGPSFTLGAGPAAPFEALLVGHQLVACGDVEEAIVIAGDCVGPSVASVFSTAELAPPAHGALALRLTRSNLGPSGAASGRLGEAQRADILARIAQAGCALGDAAQPGFGNLSAGASAEHHGLDSLSSGPGWPDLQRWLRTRVLW